VSCDPLRFSVRLGQEFRSTRVAGFSFEGRQGVFDGCADEWMDKAERKPRVQNVDAREIDDCLRG
jgi:hypothetical protein